MTSSAVFGRFSSVVMVSPYSTPGSHAHHGRPAYRQRGRGGASRRGSLLPERAHVDRAEPGHRVLARHLDGLVQAGALQDVEPADLLLGLRERAVRDQRLVATDPHRPAIAGGPELVAAGEQNPAALHLVHP